MSKYISYIDRSTIDKIQIYVDKCRHTAAELKTRLGCDYIINGGLFNWSPLSPCCQLKVDGSILVKDIYNYVGACWNTPIDFAFDVIPDNGNKWKNYIACVAMKRAGVRQDWSVSQADKNPQIGYSTNRTAIGLKGGKLALYIGTDNFKPSGLYDYLSGQGWSDILMMDGGGSTQGNLNGKVVNSSRKVHNYICVYLKRTGGLTPETPADGFVYGKNPYTMPSSVIRYGATGNGVKWAQYQLNVHGVSCGVDGSFGPAMLTAVKTFQKQAYLSIDGSIGPDTRTALSKSPSTPVAPPSTGGTSPAYTTENNPYEKPVGAVQYGATGNKVRWVQYQLNVHGVTCNIDGSFGPATLTAVKTFQKNNNLSVDGSVGPATQAVLGK